MSYRQNLLTGDVYRDLMRLLEQLEERIRDLEQERDQ